MNKFTYENKNIFRNCCRKVIILKSEGFLYDGKQVLRGNYLFLKVLFNVDIQNLISRPKLLRCFDSEVIKYNYKL